MRNPDPTAQPAPGSFSRRELFAGSAVLALMPRTAAAQAPAGKAPPSEPKSIKAAPAKLRLKPEPAPETAVWCLGEAEAPILRVKLGEAIRLRVENGTDKPLSLHWHGVRIVNAMDGVGGVTQEPIKPGASFTYDFTPPEAGSFLIRALVVGGSSEPSGRGIAGMLIVDEPSPPPVDADLALLVQDWRLDEAGALQPFGQVAFAAAAGRLGSVVTLNGRPIPLALDGRPGSRLRLRLANACNARSLRIRFDGLKAYVAAVDGQPTDTFEPLKATLPFAPGTRYDLLLDLPAQAGPAGTITALVGQGLPLATLTAVGEPVAQSGRAAIGSIPENKRLPAEIRLQSALRRELVLTGGVRPDKAKPGAETPYSGDPAKIWQINGASGTAGASPLFSVKRGGVVVLSIRNDTGFIQSLHLHGHVFRLLHQLDDGWEPYWLDTVQIPEGKSAQIAFVADNPGRWLLSATVLERFDTGLWTSFEVS
ncbi:multicopper oxidase family protein [Methylorubrum extorquens]|uniref:multicopper oxidase family protein n=1 Tax=Methylorubrum extorquens TaxID=408 RepID=UPI0001629596|nr:multicopper oxidase family protein [Methylorubrum extorquens]ABY30809.1 multicopper oxidase type 3 [Methylorubrum extorquens PA1]KQP87542.1 copper oxidase [Methylobacterium sp. Leaf119]WIU42072.1 multicopper oxidase family protein [Methylorubrum extorquens]